MTVKKSVSSPERLPTIKNKYEHPKFNPGALCPDKSKDMKVIQFPHP